MWREQQQMYIQQQQQQQTAFTELKDSRALTEAASADHVNKLILQEQIRAALVQGDAAMLQQQQQKVLATALASAAAVSPAALNGMTPQQLQQLMTSHHAPLVYQMMSQPVAELPSPRPSNHSPRK